MSLCSSFSSSWVPGSVFEEVYRLIKLDHCPPGVFNFGREVYKCNSRFNFLRVTSEGQRIKDFRVSSGREEMGGMWPRSCLGLVPVQHILPIVVLRPDPEPTCPSVGSWWICASSEHTDDQAQGKGFVSDSSHVPSALHQTLEAYLSGLNVSVAGRLSFFYWPRNHKVSLHLIIKEKAMKVCEYKIRPRHA